jgi:hypothetical protein
MMQGASKKHELRVFMTDYDLWFPKFSEDYTVLPLSKCSYCGRDRVDHPSLHFYYRAAVNEECAFKFVD